MHNDSSAYPESGQALPKRLQHLLEAGLRQNSEKPALYFENDFITFAELNQRAERLACTLLSNAEDAQVIGISSIPSISMVIGILAILKAGKAFMPIDPDFEETKILLMMQNSNLKYILDSENNAFFQAKGLKIVKEPEANLEIKIEQLSLIEGNEIAYVVYTSGSAGSAKGIEVNHASIVNYVVNAVNEYTQKDNLGAVSYFHLNLGFDASLTSLFAALGLGRALVIASRKYSNAFSDPNFLKYAPYDFLKITPYQFFEIEELNDDRALKASALFVVGGETLHYRYFKQFRQKQIPLEIVNEYGPSEACVGCISYRFNVMDDISDKPFGVPVGKAMSGVRAYVLNEKFEEVAAGEIGEIVLGGVQISSGYIRQNSPLGKAFRRDTFTDDKNARLYRTGDYATVNADGIIEYVCREERLKSIQTKQFNTCVLELELMKIEGIQHAIVISAETDTTRYPICYLSVLKSQENKDTINAGLIRLFGKSKYPVVVTLIDNFPLTMNKKLDKHELPLAWLKNVTTYNNFTDIAYGISDSQTIWYFAMDSYQLSALILGDRHDEMTEIKLMRTNKKPKMGQFFSRFFGKETYLAWGN